MELHNIFSIFFKSHNHALYTIVQNTLVDFGMISGSFKVTETTLLFQSTYKSTPGVVIMYSVKSLKEKYFLNLFLSLTILLYLSVMWYPYGRTETFVNKKVTTVQINLATTDFYGNVSHQMQYISVNSLVH